jgi:hypothetical protein
VPPAVAHLEGGGEGGSRDLDLAELAHPILAVFLFFEELRLRGPATGMGQAGPARRGTRSTTSGSARNGSWALAGPLLTKLLGSRVSLES